MDNLFGMLVIIVILAIAVGGYLLYPRAKEKVNNIKDDLNDNGEIIKRCEEVSLEYISECCEDWAKENNIIKVTILKGYINGILTIFCE